MNTSAGISSSWVLGCRCPWCVGALDVCTCEACTVRRDAHVRELPEAPWPTPSEDRR